MASGASSPAPKTSPQKQMCMLAKRVPKLARSGDEEEDLVNEERRTALIGVIQFLHNEPEKTVATFLAFTSGQIKLSCAANGSWVDSYNCVGRFPKYWKTQLLVASSRGDLTLSQLNKINMRDPNAISNLFELAGQLPEGASYPSGFLNTALSSQLFLRRFADLGDRIRKLKSTGALADDGTVDYSKFASYVVVWGEGSVATEVVHIDGDRAALPKSLVVTPSFRMEAACQELSSSLVEGQCKLSLVGLFPAGPGPHRHAPPSKPKRWKRAPDECVFSRLHSVLQALPGAQWPTAVEPDPKLLFASDEAAREKRKVSAAARLVSSGGLLKRRKVVSLTSTT